MSLRDIPNVLTVARMLMIVPTVWALAREEYGLALGLFAVAGLSDALDGYLAKRFDWSSRLGAILDPIADKGLLTTTYITLAWLGHIPVWLVVAVLARDVIIVLGATAYYLLIGYYEMSPTFISKVNTFLQIAFGVFVVASLTWSDFAAPMVAWLTYLVFATTVLSGIDYVWTWGRRAWRARHHG